MSLTQSNWSRSRVGQKFSPSPRTSSSVWVKVWGVKFMTSNVCVWVNWDALQTDLCDSVLWCVVVLELWVFLSLEASVWKLDCLCCLGVSETLPSSVGLYSIYWSLPYWFCSTCRLDPPWRLLSPYQTFCLYFVLATNYIHPFHLLFRGAEYIHLPEGA